ncbi:MAG TPA: rhodanese-like domain-containing protein [Armatimonadota bacterium]|jgi:rhodanese-related sulfurtransferase
MIRLLILLSTVFVLTKAIAAGDGQSTVFYDYSRPSGGPRMRSEVPSFAPLAAAPIRIDLSRDGKPLKPAKVTIELHSPKEPKRILSARFVSPGVYVALADITKPGAYGMTVTFRSPPENIRIDVPVWEVGSIDTPRISPVALRPRWTSGNAILLDIRSDPEHRIKGGIAMLSTDLTNRMATLPKDRLIAVFCDCVSEYAAVPVVQQLLSAGYRAAAVYGGTRGLRENGWTTEPPTEPEPCQR